MEPKTSSGLNDTWAPYFYLWYPVSVPKKVQQFFYQCLLSLNIHQLNYEFMPLEFFFSKIFFLLHPWTWNQHLKFLLEIKWTFSFKRFENKNRLEVMKVEESRNMWHFFDPLSRECPLIQVSEAKGASECTRQPTVILCYLFKTLHRCSAAQNWLIPR